MSVCSQGGRSSSQGPPDGIHYQKASIPHPITHVRSLTLILLTWTIWRAPTNASKWRMGFNSAFKGLTTYIPLRQYIAWKHRKPVDYLTVKIVITEFP